MQKAAVIWVQTQIRGATVAWEYVCVQDLSWDGGPQSRRALEQKGNNKKRGAHSPERELRLISQPTFRLTRHPHMCTPPQIRTSLDAAYMTCGFVTCNVFFLPQATKKKDGHGAAPLNGKQSGQARVGTRDHTNNKNNNKKVITPSHRTVQCLPLFFYIETSPTELMQQTQVQRNIFLCSAFHLNSHACHGGGACVTPGMVPKYQAACCGEWMPKKNAHVSV
ncbi:hypothetical protein TcCL_ESM02810 [Trypanosoma cruzi]|nr:hypothetical protein TcCL_ESM02810 [Trypanosoma cruzi]